MAIVSWSWNGLTVEAEESYYWPTPTVTTLSQSYKSSHGGIDIATPVGTNIYATKSGTVIGIGTACSCIGKGPKSDNPCGHLLYYNGEYVAGIGSGIIIKHDDGSGYAQYGHMTADSWPTEVYLGAHVNQGQFIGKTGNSGLSSGPHLHFELRDNASKYVYKCNRINSNKDKIDYVYDYQTTVDAQKPTISKVKVSEIDKTGYTVTCEATDDIGIMKVCFPTWTEANEQDDLSSNWYEDAVGTKVGNNTYSYRVNISDHNNEGGKYITHVYAIDSWGNYSIEGVSAIVDLEAPSISNVRVSDVTTDGYTVTCEAIDNVGVMKVCFPTWTEANDQDDLSNNWYEDAVGTKVDNSNTYSFRVNTSDHNNEGGKYITHVYAIDEVGNYSIEAIVAVIDLEAPVISKTTISDITADGYTVTCEVTDNVEVARVCFPTWTVAGGKDDLNGDWYSNNSATGERVANSNTYTFRVNISDHNNESGIYRTDIYAYDKMGNYVSTTITAEVGITINGTVKSYGDTTNQVLISAQDAGGNVETAVVGNDEGYELKDVSAGTYTISVSKEHHVPRTYTVTVDDANVTQDMEIYLIGDVTGDGSINARDKKLVYNHIAGTSVLTDYIFAVGDVTGDGVINAKDKKLIYNHIAGTSSLWK